MNKNVNQQSNKNEEIDLGSLFAYIERMFAKIGTLLSRIFESILWVLNKLLVLVLLIINICFKKYTYIIIAGILGYIIVHLLSMRHTDMYISSMMVRQNYATGNLLYSNINKYSELAAQRDSVKLGKELNIPSELASKIVKVSINSNVNRNRLIQEYTEYLKSIDSSLTVGYEQFVESFDSENMDFQTINVVSLDSSLYSYISEPILNAINKNPYYVNVHERDLNQITNRINTLNDLIVETDSLQNQYIELLNKYYGSNVEDRNEQSTINLNLTNNKDKISTKEFDLYERQSSYQLQINDLKDQLELKQNIIEVIKEFSNPTLVENPYANKKIYGSLILMGLIILFFFNKEFNFTEYIKKKGTKEGFFGQTKN